MIGLWTDHRIGGHPRIVHGDSRDLMQIPDEARKLVCFIHGSGTAQDGTKQAWVGTGFFVFDPLGVLNEEGEEQNAIYIVTARHCVQQIDPDDPTVESIQIRLNTTDGRSERIDTDPELWAHHEIADVSVYGLAPPRDRYDYLNYPIRGQMGPFYDTSTDPTKPRPHLPVIGPGEEVFLTGVLFYHQGQSRMMPIVRVGTIAAFPDDPVELSTGNDYAILIECRSIGGLSGSPVFVHFPPWRYDENWNVAHLATPDVPGNAGPNYLMGVMHGIYTSEGSDLDGLGDASGEPLNTGIAAVIPIERAVELIDGPILKPIREAVKEHLEAENAPKRTSAPDAPAPANLEFENFDALASKLVQVPKSEIS